MGEGKQPEQPRDAFTRPSIDETLETLRSWLRGFIRKEYGAHVHSDDLLDFEQEGCAAIVNWITNSRTAFGKFKDVEEYYFYAKAVARNAIRDYDLKYFSRFNISLFKLRRELKKMAASDEYIKNPHRQRLGDYMHRLGVEYTDRVTGESSEVIEAAILQNRLDLLSHMSDPNLTDVERKVILVHVICEYKRERGIRSPFPRAPLQLVVVDGKPVVHKDRTPLPHTAINRKVCANRLCGKELDSAATVISTPGFGYCSPECLKQWPPVVNRIQREFDTAIEIVLDISMKLFRSRRKAAEIIGISPATMAKLISRFAAHLKQLQQ